MDFGVVFEARSTRVVRVQPHSLAEQLGLVTEDRLTHVGGIPVCNRTQAMLTWAAREQWVREELSVWRQDESLRFELPAGLTSVNFPPELSTAEAQEATRPISVRERALLALVAADPRFRTDVSEETVERLRSSLATMETTIDLRDTFDSVVQGMAYGAVAPEQRSRGAA